MKILFLFSILLFSVSALAEEPRKIDFTVVLTDQDNEPLTECSDQPAPKEDRDCKTRRPITLGMVTLRALAVPETGLAPEDSLKRGQLGLSVYKARDAQLSSEEITLIKKQLAKAFGPFLVAKAFPLLDPVTAK